MKYIRILLVVGLIGFSSPLAAANWWVETTGEDFVDGEYTASLYAADTGIADDGAVQMIHYRDIDTDGNLDLVISNNRTGTIASPGPALYAFHYDNLMFVDSLFSYNGSGNLIVDYDNDGNLDIVLSAYDDASWNTNIDSRVCYGPGFDSASAQTFPTNQAMAVSAADLDKDGDLDLVFSNYAGNNASIYYQGTAAPQNLACAANCGNAIADLDKDGNLDIVLSGLYGLIYYGPGYTSVDTVPLIGSLTDVSIADLDENEQLDLVFSALGDSSYIAYGPDFTLQEAVYTRNARAVSVADVGVGPELDLVFSNWFDPDSGFDISSYVYYGPDYSATLPQTLPTHGSVGNVIGDFNGDRALDIFFSNWITPDSIFDTLSFVYFGPDLMLADTLASFGAHMSTTTDAGNPYNRTGEEIYVSSIYDAVDSVEWDSVLYTAVIPAGSDFFLEIQTGNVLPPDASWSDWLPVASGDTLPDSLASQYIRYRGTLITDFLQAPRLEEVRISYPSEGDVAPDSIISPRPEDVTDCASRALIVQVINLGSTPATFPVHCIRDSLGVTRFDSTLMAVDLAGGDSTILYFGGMYCCPGDTLWVITEFADDVVPENDTLFAHLGPTAIQEQPQAYEFEFEVSPAPQGFDVAYTLPAEERITLVVYDAAGRTLKVLDEGTRETGRHYVAWDGRDSKGLLAPAGVYFVRFETQTRILTRKIVIVD